MDNQKPCIVKTTQGFSISYKAHFLYSKYNPAKNIIRKIEETDFLPGSVILCLSPVLLYGLNALMEKMPDHCIAVLCEKDRFLYEFMQETFFHGQNNNASLSEESRWLCDDRILFPSPEELDKLPLILYEKNSHGSFRRIIPIEFSAGTQFHQDFYRALSDSCTDSIMTFWKNRVTLTKFGRKYSRNFFENLSSLERTEPIENYMGSVKKPVLCFGAGESTDAFFSDHSFGGGAGQSAAHELSREDFFILCADTALAPLMERGILPDGVFLEEAQSVILKSFIGMEGKASELRKENCPHIFAGLTSSPGIRRELQSERQISYFFTEFTQAEFLKKALEPEILPPRNPGFGSVGLTMVWYALKFRAGNNIPVFITGLDFSYSPGRTHARGTFHHKNMVLSQTRLKSLYNMNATFNENTRHFLDKSGKSFCTTPLLSSYAELFRRTFGNQKNLFDSGKTGIPLGLPYADVSELYEGRLILEGIRESAAQPQAAGYVPSARIKDYLKEERNALEELRQLLTGKTELQGDALRQRITQLAECREYLFLHNPDGCEFKYEQSFLNRVRTEIDFFLKILTFMP